MKHNEANKHTKLHQVSDTFHLPKLESSKQQAALCECAAVSCISEVARTASSAHPTGTWLLWLWIVWPEAHLGHPLDIFRHHGEIYTALPKITSILVPCAQVLQVSHWGLEEEVWSKKHYISIEKNVCHSESFQVVSSHSESCWVRLSHTESFWVIPYSTLIQPEKFNRICA